MNNQVSKGSGKPQNTRSHNIGFKSGLYDTRVAVYSGHAENIRNDAKFDVPVDKPSQNMYLYSICKAIDEYINEEIQGTVSYPEMQLKTKIEAARALFPEDRKNLRNYRHVTFG